MARAALYISNFTSGELSTRLYGRIDIKKYLSGCRTLENMMVHVHGGATRRAGTRFVQETKSSGQARLVPFRYAPGTAYILEMGEGYVRFYKNNSSVLSGTTPYEIVSPFTVTQMANVKYCRANADLYFVHPDVAPYKLVRTTDTSWTFNPVSFTAIPPVWTTGSYPNALAFYEQRMFYATNDTIYGSVSQLPDDFTTGTDDDDSVKYVTATEQIRWLTSGRKLMVGDYGGEWTFSSGSDDLAITPTRAKMRNDTNFGSSHLQGLKVGQAVLFLQKAQRRIRQMAYQYITDTFNSDDVSVLAEHITKPYISDWDYQSEPDSVVWSVRGDGQVVGLSYDQSQEVLAWHHHITGTSTSDLFESIAIVPRTEGTQVWDYDRDVVWVVAARYIGGAWKRYVEYFMPQFDGVNAELSDAFYVDCGVRYESTARTVATGLVHITGRTVSILADGSVQPDAIVSTGGTVAIDPAATTIAIGLPYTSILEPLSPEGGSPDGTSQGKRKRIHDIMVRFYKTLGANVGTNSSNMDIIQFRTPSDPMDSHPTLFSGDKIVPFQGGWDENGYIRITQSQPLPMTVLSISPRIEVND